MYGDQNLEAWEPGSNTTFHPAAEVKWRELSGLEHLEDGAMCSCYTAQLGGHGTIVIKKPSRRSNERVEEIHRQLAIEKAYLATLRHPNIIRLIGSGRRGLTNDLEPFLVLEYLEENTLTHLISKQRRGRLDMPPFVDGKKNYIPWPQAMEWARDIASALHYMHHEASPRYMYICRDLKPDNIGFAADGTIKVFDLGLAKRVTRKTGTMVRYTMTSRCGTIRYMAPEAFLGCSYNEKVDVYAWSHVVAEMLSLDVPYKHMTTQEFRETVAMGHRRPHVERRWPRSIKRLLRRCWDRDPAVRPGFGELLESGILEQAAGRQAAGPQHSWFHNFSFRRLPSTEDPGGNVASAGGGARHNNKKKNSTATHDTNNNGHKAAAAVVPVAPAPAEGAARARVATVDFAGEPHHRSPAPLPEGAAATAAAVTDGMAPVASVGEEMDASGADSIGFSQHEGVGEEVEQGTDSSGNTVSGRMIRLGPLVLPLCFFGGGPKR